MSDTFRYDFVDGGGSTTNRRRSIRTGSTWRKRLTIKKSDGSGDPEDISNWTFQMMVRKTPSSDTVIIELSTANTRIAFETDGTDGKINLLLSEAETAALLAEAGENVYDIKYQISGGDKKDLFEGKIEILASPTRS